MLFSVVALNALANMLATPSLAKSEYAKSTKPPFAPPAWLFGIAWPINNLLTMWGNHKALNAPPSDHRTAYIRLQAVIWTLFVTYGFVRFRLRSPILGCVNTVAFLVLTMASASRAARIDRSILASYVTLVPWLALATTLSIYELSDSDHLFGG